MSALLEVENLAKFFPVRGQARSAASRVPHLSRLGRQYTATLHAVDGVSFHLQRGETLGLVGESGCGKSTLARLIVRLLDSTSGSIRFRGVDIGAIPARKFVSSPQRGRLQMVFQDATDSLNPRFTAFDCIADPVRRLARDKRGRALTELVEMLAEMVGLERGLLQRYPHQLSGGQRARVGIARAIAVEPELVVLDEPTSALDVSVQVLNLQLLQSLKERLGVSYLFVSHDLNVVRLLCDRVLVMYLGKIVESGPVDRVFAAPAHPYTRALLSAIPSQQLSTQPARQRLSGEPRSPIDPDPQACRFADRCPARQPRCTAEAPSLREVAQNHLSACHFPNV